MCGIVGIAAVGAVDRAALAAATDGLAHRGPDGDGLWIGRGGAVGFGHRRLAIIDPTPAGAQPMTSGDGRFVITFNGEIYNYRALRSELQAMGRRFTSGSDTEVLLEGYGVWGAGVLDRLNGIFAFAIHDAVSGEVFVARDHMGVKPLYYAETGAGVVFASEIKALLRLAPDISELDLSAVRKYVTFLWCPGEQTMLRAVRKLPPGSALLIREGGVVRRWSYWRPPHYQPRRDWSPRQCAAELAQMIEVCVERQMVADVPVGAFLSGGLDSSSIVAAARRQAPNIHTFTIDLGDAVEDGETDDLPYARRAAGRLGVPLHEVKVDARTLFEGVAGMVEVLDEPLADPACLNAYFISRLAREHGIKVLLSGAGGDDIFTGYRRHTLLALSPYWRTLPTSLRRSLAATIIGRHGPLAPSRRLAKALSLIGGEAPEIAANFAWGPHGIGNELVRRDATGWEDGEDVLAPLEGTLQQVGDEPIVEQCLHLEKRFFLADHNLTYTDKMAMATGVEVRVPLIDIELLEFASQIPVEWKHRGLTTKWIMKKSQEGLLPRRIIYRPKTGFGAPLRRWMKGEMRGLADELLSRGVLEARGLFDPKAVERLRKADAEGLVDGSYTLFSLMCVELWCRAFLKRPAGH